MDLKIRNGIYAEHRSRQQQQHQAHWLCTAYRHGKIYIGNPKKLAMVFAMYHHIYQCINKWIAWNASSRASVRLECWKKTQTTTRKTDLIILFFAFILCHLKWIANFYIYICTVYGVHFIYVCMHGRYHTYEYIFSVFHFLSICLGHSVTCIPNVRHKIQTPRYG